MPVEEDDLAAAAARYGATLAARAGAPPELDLVHIGLGADGHTASLFPGDPALAIVDSWVATTGSHAGFRRMTLTLGVLAGARRIVWLISGGSKADALAGLVAGDGRLPAGRVPRERARVVTDIRGASR